MAGRKFRLYDTVEDKWINYGSEAEMDAVFKDKKKNTLVTTKKYGASLRYELSEPVSSSELLKISLGGKPSRADSPAAKVYKQTTGKSASKKVGTMKSTTGKGTVDVYENALGINPAFDNSFYKSNPKLRPSTATFFSQYNRYYKFDTDGNYTDNIKENYIGSAERRALQAQSKDKDEESKSWLSGYYNFMKGGYDALTDDQKVSYETFYATKNKNMWAIKPSYDPTSPHVFKGRALNSVAGDKAIDRYLEEMDVPEDSPFRSLAGMTNTDLAKLSESNQSVSDFFDAMMDHYMLGYYSKVYNKYKDEPETIAQDVEKNGDYARLKKNLADPNNIRQGVQDIFGLEKNGIANKTVSGIWGGIANLGNELISNYGVQARNIFDDTKIENAQRDRAKEIVDSLSGKLAQQNIEKVNSLKGDTKTYNDYLKNIGFSEEKFDNLANNFYSYYKEHDNLDLTVDQKRDMYITFATEAEALGEELASKRFAEALQNIDATNQDTLKKCGYAANNLGTTIVSTVANIGNFAYEWNPATIIGDIYSAATNEGSFWNNLGDNISYRWEETLNNDFANWAARLSSTGAWTTSEQERLEKLGIQSTPILRKAGNENELRDINTLYDLVPVTGYMMGASGGSYIINGVSKAMNALGTASKTLAVASKINQVVSKGAEATAFGVASRASIFTNKFLRGASKLLDASAPAIATAGMDFGYAKDNYDSAIKDAMSFVYKTDEKGNQVYNDEFLAMASEKADREIQAKHDADQAKLGENERIIINPQFDAQVKSALIKKYANEYIQEAESIAKVNAGLTFGLTIIPDVHLSNTWRKAMFSKTSRGALADMQNTMRKVFNMKPKPVESYISGVEKKNGKWYINGKKFNRKDLAKEYGKMSAGGFVSNYLQDIGVAAGQGVQESMLHQYIDQRFNKDATDAVSYDIDQVLFAATQHSGHALGEFTSFRDGLYGALAPFLFNPHVNVKGLYREGMNSNTKTANFGKALWKNLHMNSLAYNLTFGAKDIINAENERRAKLHTTVQNWLDTNGNNFLGHIGGFLELSKQEKQAIKNNDYSSFQASRMGQIVNTASMLVQLGNVSPLAATTIAYMKDRANRKDVTQEDIDNLHKVALQVQADREQGLSIEEALSNVPVEDRNLVKDLIDIQALNTDINSKDSRTEVQQLNDIRDNAKDMLDIMSDLQNSMSEAEARFGDTADLVVKQEYAKVRAYQKSLQRQIDNQTKLLKKINSGIQFTEAEKGTTTLPLNSDAITVLAEFGGDITKVQEEIEKNKQSILNTKNLIFDLKLQRQEAESTDEKQYNTQAIKVLETLNSVPKTRNIALQETINAWNELTEEQKEQKPVIAAQDMLNLSEADLLKLLTSKHLSTEQQAQVNTFLETADEWANDNKAINGSYVEILQSKLDNLNRLKQASLEEGLDSRGLQLLNKAVSDRRQQQARDFYKKSFESLADELQYYADTETDFNTDTGDMSITGKTYHNIEQKAYENFLKKYKEQYNEISSQENAEELLAGLHEAIKDNTFYKQYQKNTQELNRVNQDINQYVDPNKFSQRERQELKDILEFAVVTKGMDTENLLSNLSNTDTQTLENLKSYLEDRGHTPGSIEDIKNRLITYNHNITDTMETNKKAAEERQKQQEQHSEVKKTQNEKAEKSLVNTINNIVTYTSASQDNNMSAMRKLMDILGVKDSSNINNYTNEVVSAFKSIIELAINESDLKNMLAIVDSETAKYMMGLDGKPKLGGQSYANLLLLTEYFKRNLQNTSNKLVPYQNPITGTVAPSTTNNTTAPTVSLMNDLNTVDPFEFTDLSIVPDNPLQQMVENAKVQEFLKNTGIPRGTKLVFIANNEWSSQVAQAMNDSYNEGNDMPLFGAVEVHNATATTITIDGKHYQILGVIPSTTKVRNTAIIRSHAIANPSNSGPYIVKESNGTILSTNIESNPHSIIDVDAEPTPVKLAGQIITSNNFQVEEDSSGKHIRTNQTPGSNDIATDRANWSYVEVQNTDVTEDKEGKTIDQVDDAATFNSRTQGFNGTIQKILELVKGNQSTVKTVLKQMSDANSKEHGINQRIPNSDETSLAQYISLANGYRYALSLSNGNVVLLLIDERNKPVKKNGQSLSWILANKESLAAETLESVTPVSDILKDLCTLKDDMGDTIAKWQVSYGNFDLSNGKGTDLKQVYIKQAVDDGILYVKPVKTEFDIQIYPVQDTLAKNKIAADNAAREQAAAQAVINAHINPTTGDIIDTNDVGQSVESALDKVRKGDFWSGVIGQKLIQALGRIQQIKNQVGARRQSQLKINQHQSRTSNTGTTSLLHTQGVIKTPQDYCRFVVGTVVDTAIRDFFNPTMSEKMKDSSYFKELFKEVLSEQASENLYNAVNRLRNSFAQEGWRIISNGIYTIDEQLNNKVVGEVDLLAIDSMGNFHIIDIKTYSANSFSDMNGSYAKQLSMYHDDMQRNLGIHIPKENLHIYALQVDNSADLYNVSTDKQTGITTVTKKPSKASKIQIKASANFELFDSRHPSMPVSYVGEEVTKQLMDRRRGFASDSPTTNAPSLTEQATQPEVLEQKNKVNEYREALRNADANDRAAIAEAIVQNTQEAYSKYLQDHQEGDFREIASHGLRALGALREGITESQQVQLDAFKEALSNPDGVTVEDTSNINTKDSSITQEGRDIVEYKGVKYVVIDDLVDQSEITIDDLNTFRAVDYGYKSYAEAAQREANRLEAELIPNDTMGYNMAIKQSEFDNRIQDLQEKQKALKESKKAENDPIINEVLEWAKNNWDGTGFSIQRKFSIGYLRADRIADYLKTQGFKGINTDISSQVAAETAAQDNTDNTNDNEPITDEDINDENIPDAEDDESATPDSYLNNLTTQELLDKACGH